MTARLGAVTLSLRADAIRNRATTHANMAPFGCEGHLPPGRSTRASPSEIESHDALARRGRSDGAGDLRTRSGDRRRDRTGPPAWHAATHARASAAAQRRNVVADGS